jgi:hypothetical protein
MEFPRSTVELMSLLLPHQQKIRSNPILREAVRILAVGFAQGIGHHDPDYLIPEDAVISIAITDNMRAAFAVIVEELRP